MRAVHILAIYVLNLISAQDGFNIIQDFGRGKRNFISVDFGPVHLHIKTGDLPEKHVPLRWDDKYATGKTNTLVNFLISLPELNPLNKTLRNYNVSIADVGLSANLNIWNLLVTGIKDLTVNNIEMRVASPRLDFNVSIPRITIKGDFNLLGSYDSLQIYNIGHFNVTLLDLRVVAAIGIVTTRANTELVYKLDSADVTIDVKDLQLRMSVMAFAENIKLVLNQFFEYTEDLVVDNNLLSIVLNAINQKLRKIPAKQIMDYMLGTSTISSLNGFNRKGTTISGRKYGK